MSNAVNDAIYDSIAEVLGDLTPAQCQEIDDLVQAGEIETAQEKANYYHKLWAKKYLKEIEGENERG